MKFLPRPIVARAKAFDYTTELIEDLIKSGIGDLERLILIKNSLLDYGVITQDAANYLKINRKKLEHSYNKEGMPFSQKLKSLIFVPRDPKDFEAKPTTEEIPFYNDIEMMKIKIEKMEETLKNSKLPKKHSRAGYYFRVIFGIMLLAIGLSFFVSGISEMSVVSYPSTGFVNNAFAGFVVIIIGILFASFGIKLLVRA